MQSNRIAWWLLATLLATVRPAPAVLAQGDYKIGAKDVLAITVWDQTDLSGKYTVEGDGTFSFPMIGRVKASGLTLGQLEAELKKRLADGYFKNPQVAVAIEQYHSQRIFVVGEVRSPGTYPLTGDMTLIEALASAGSILATAGGEVLIVRPPVGRPVSGPLLPNQEQRAEIIRVPLGQIQQGLLSQNVSLRDGDTVFVPRAEMIYIYGQVRSPGAYPVQKGTTVMQALTLAGGLTDRGSTRRIKILRTVDGKKKELAVKLTDLVHPGDTVIVSERFF